MVSHGRRKELAEDLRVVFAAPTRELALEVAGRVADRWLESHPKVAEHIEEHLEDCLTCLSLPKSHRRRIRTTNGLKGLNQEIKRRTRVVRIFPNRKACLRLVTSLAVEQSEEWITGRRYLDMDELLHKVRSEAQEEEIQEVVAMER